MIFEGQFFHIHIDILILTYFEGIIECSWTILEKGLMFALCLNTSTATHKLEKDLSFMVLTVNTFFEIIQETLKAKTAFNTNLSISLSLAFQSQLKSSSDDFVTVGVEAIQMSLFRP